MSEEKKSFGNIQVNQASNSIIGQHIENATIQRTAEPQVKSKEELIHEILGNYSQYIEAIEELTDLESEQKEAATEAVWEIRKELKKEQPDEQKIKSIWEPIQKTSYVAAICSAICDLVGLMN